MLQQALERITAAIAWPGFVALLCLMVLGWMCGNLAMAGLGFHPFDPPPFPSLQSASSIGALLMATLIVTTQRHEAKLADHRAQLLLELAIANDQKVAKIIQLLEESRRDNPALADRVDEQAAVMSNPSDTDAVLEAIKELRDDNA